MGLIRRRYRNAPSHLLLFSDLDGTLLDLKTFSFQAARPALERIRRTRTPLVFCSAKTGAELKAHQRQMNLSEPFIAENGGAIYLPKGYFHDPDPPARFRGDWGFIPLAIPYRQVCRILKEIRAETGLPLKGFSEMSAEEVAVLTGLNLQAARRAKAREFDETVQLGFAESSRQGRAFSSALARRGLTCVHGGTLHHVAGGSDKGRAVRILTALYQKKLGRLRTVGIGDSLNDLSLLSAVEEPILVQRPGGSWVRVSLPRLRRVRGIGPVGWNRAVRELLLRIPEVVWRSD